MRPSAAGRDASAVASAFTLGTALRARRGAGASAVAWARRFDARGVLEGIADDATPRFRRYDWRLNDRPR